MTRLYQFNDKDFSWADADFIKSISLADMYSFHIETNTLRYGALKAPCLSDPLAFWTLLIDFCIGEPSNG